MFGFFVTCEKCMWKVHADYIPWRAWA